MGTGQMDWTFTQDGSYSVEVKKTDAYPLIIGRGRLDGLAALLHQVSEGDAVFIITDECVSKLWLEHTRALLVNAGFLTQSVVIANGETSKSWPTAQHLLSFLSEHGAKRRSVLLALGGGVICDLVGFVASIFMRGLPYICVPTTLMAQLDAAIGGKTGIDFSASKNLVGAFHHPAAILVDPNLLATLPSREIRSGLAEAIKVGILHSALFALLERAAPIQVNDLDTLSSIVTDAIVGKMRLLRADPFENSLMRLLNLGHTVAHALEAATRFETYRHGEAVAIGIAVATEISRSRGLCQPRTRDRILACLTNCGLQISLPPEHVAATWSGMDIIRRIRDGKLNEVLPVTIGQCVIVDEIGLDEYEAAVGTLTRWAKHAAVKT